MVHAASARVLRNLAVAHVEKLETTGEMAVVGEVDEAIVEVRYQANSGVFYVVSGDETNELSGTDLRDLGPALARYQQRVPWADDVLGQVLRAVNDAVFPTVLGDLCIRSVSDEGSVVLLTGKTPRQAIDLILDAKTLELSIIVTTAGQRSPRRDLWSQEAWDVSRVLAQALAKADRTTGRLLHKVWLAAKRTAAH